VLAKEAMRHVSGDKSRESGEIRAADVRVRLLGSVRVEVAGHGPLHAPRKVGELLGFVALGGGGRPVARDDVAFGLWPDRTEEGARRALAGALYRLRRLIPDSPGWFVTERDSLQIRDVWIDSEAFARLADSADPSDWSEALDLYAGDLMPAVDAEWVDLPRTILRERFVALLAAVTAEHEAAGDLAAALGWARRWSAGDPLDEAAHRAVMRLYARLDRHAAALDHFDALVGRLESELDVEPLPETRDLADRIRSELALAGRTAAAARAAPLVGREDERNRLLTLLDHARSGHGGLAIVVGEAGIGKSRLLQEIEASATWRGWQVAYGRGEEFGSPAPYAPVSNALRAAIPPSRREQLQQLVERVWLAGASSLVPALAPTPSWRAEPSTRHLAHAIAEVLRGLGRLGPQLLLLDDVQWADDEIWTLLEDLRPALAELPVLVIASGRTDELRAQPVAWSRLEAWDRALVPFVHLRGLDAGELATLSSGLDARSRSAAELTALANASGGNPLLALALLTAGAGAGGSPSVTEPGDLRASLDRMFEHRLAALSAGARAALEAAAVVGQRFPYTLWLEVSGEPDLPALAAELERSQLLRLEEDGYSFAHDTLRSLVVWQLPADRRRQLNRAALDAARRRTPDDAVALLFHAEQLGEGAEIAEWSLRAGEQALAGLSFGAAARHFSRAIEVLPAGDHEARYRALIGRVRAIDVLADRDAERVDLNELEDLAAVLGGAGRRIETARLSAAFHWAVGEYPEGEAVAARALEVATAEGDVQGQAALLTITGRILREQGRLADARAALTRAQVLYGRLNDVHGAATALELLGGIAWRLGDHAVAARQHAEAADLFQQIGDVRRAAISLNSVGTALWGLGDYEGARLVHVRSLATCREIGDRRVESDNLDNLGGVAWVLADYERAIELYNEALAIRRESHDPRGIAISLVNLGDTYTLVGETDKALAHYDEALEVDRGVGVRRNEATTLQGKGKALLDAGRHEEARRCLEAAVAIHVGLGDRDNLADARAALAKVCLALGDVAAARSAAAAALEGLETSDRATLRQWARYAAWQVAEATGDPAAAEHLSLAAAAMDEFVGSLVADVRSRVLARVPMNRLTDAARRAATRQIDRSLARVDVPLGRSVGDGDLVAVSWTLFDPADAAIVDPAERRRHVLARLVGEAAAQGGAPTDGDLASALGVSRRTIIRDAQELARAGRPLDTRRRSRMGSAEAAHG
jgi:DNA-binding SARP family transcriptional activator/tetratricopeptide (TPR) repeat protein